MSNKKSKKKNPQKTAAKAAVSKATSGEKQKMTFSEIVSEWMWLISLVIIALVIGIIVLATSGSDSKAGGEQMSVADMLASDADVLNNTSGTDATQSTSAETQTTSAETQPTENLGELVNAGDGDGGEKNVIAASDGAKAADGEQLKLPSAGEQIAVLETSKGVIKMRLFPEQAPLACENFTTHVKNGYYNGLSVYALLKDQALYSGDPSNTGLGGESIWGDPFEVEVNRNLYNFYGAVGMAKSPEDNTNNIRFYIVTNSSFKYDAESFHNLGWPAWASKDYVERGGSWSFDYEFKGLFGDGDTMVAYTVFGQVFEGLDVVAAINNAEINDEGHIVENITIDRAYLDTYKG